MQNLTIQQQALNKLIPAFSCPSGWALPFVFSNPPKCNCCTYQVCTKKLNFYVKFLFIKNYTPSNLVAKQILKMPSAVLNYLVLNNQALTPNQQKLINKRYMQAHNYINNLISKFVFNI
jgi:hypothetical protein